MSKIIKISFALAAVLTTSGTIFFMNGENYRNLLRREETYLLKKAPKNRQNGDNPSVLLANKTKRKFYTQPKENNTVQSKLRKLGFREDTYYLVCKLTRENILEELQDRMEKYGPKSLLVYGKIGNETPLSIAVALRSPEAVKYILKQILEFKMYISHPELLKIESRTNNNNYKKPLDHAYEIRAREIINIFEKHKEKIKKLYERLKELKKELEKELEEEAIKELMDLGVRLEEEELEN